MMSVFTHGFVIIFYANFAVMREHNTRMSLLVSINRKLRLPQDPAPISMSNSTVTLRSYE